MSGFVTGTKYLTSRIKRTKVYFGAQLVRVSVRSQLAPRTGLHGRGFGGGETAHTHGRQEAESVKAACLSPLSHGDHKLFGWHQREGLPPSTPRIVLNQSVN